MNKATVLKSVTAVIGAGVAAFYLGREFERERRQSLPPTPHTSEKAVKKDEAPAQKAAVPRKCEEIRLVDK